ncbi:MAG: polysaccharide deacetylase family protein [Bacteroidales bacterium]|nr:polysaccharide deacetylase family protein [Bacteroidales bacterium]
MKEIVQTAIRAAHLTLLRKSVPDKICLYDHSLRGRTNTLDELLSRFGDMGYSFVGSDEYFTGTGKLVLLSFDDNYKSWYDCLPLLERRGAKATFYVNSFPFRDRVGAEDLKWFFGRISAAVEPTLTTDELRCIAACGHVIGAHTHTHPMLAATPIEEAKKEILLGKQVLEDILGIPVTHFAYPFGMRRHFSQDLQKYCFDIGFSTIATGIPCQQFGSIQPGLIHRSYWNLDSSFQRNLENLQIDGRLFERLTGYNPTAGGH